MSYVKFRTHTILQSKDCECEKYLHCNICDGGLAFCTVCKGGEQQLYDHTCQERLNMEKSNE